MTEQQKKQQLDARVSALTLRELVELFELTEQMPSRDSVVPILRGLLMDEMESRNPSAFSAWMESTDPQFIRNPSRFFLAE